MIYFAQRAPRSYREKLLRLSRVEDSLDIVSVIGGLSFLHALSDKTRQLALIDPDPDTHLYCKMVIALLKNSVSGQEFLEMLTRHSVSEKWWLPGCFKERKQNQERVLECLAEPSLAELYGRTFGAMEFEREHAVGKIGESRILFFENDLTPMTFCWGIGFGAFASNQSFEVLNSVLNRITPSYIQARFEDLDYDSLLGKPGAEAVVLVSNTESPLFSKNDSVFRAVAQRINRSVRYVSWHRELTLKPESSQVQSGQDALRLLLSKEKCCLLRAHLSEAVPQGSVLYENLDDLKARLHYGWGIFYLDVSSYPQEEIYAELGRLLKEIVPCFSRIVIWGGSGIAGVFKAVEEVSFQRSYELSKLEWYSGNFLMAWGLKGT